MLDKIYDKIAYRISERIIRELRMHDKANQHNIELVLRLQEELRQARGEKGSAHNG